MRENVPLAGARPGAMSQLRRNAWDRGSVFWYAYYGVTFAISLLVVLASSGITARERILASLALVAMACWYVALGRVLAQRVQPGALRETLYLGVLLALFAVAETQTSAITFILLALSPQCFFAASTFRRAVAFVVVFNAIPAVVATATGSIRSRNMAELIGIAVLGIAFSVAFGTWNTGIIDQSKGRADLIEQLQATQAELAAVHREAGVLAERQRLASEIHDTIAQGFASIVMLIQAAEPEIGHDDGAARRYLGIAARTARENLAEARALVAALTPAHLASGSLDDALRRLAERTGAEHDLPAVFEVCGEVRPLPASAEVVLLRVCQDAQASTAWVLLTYGPCSVRLAVTDDGAGFDPAAVNGGFGLRGMRGRAGEGGGTLTVRSAPGEGTSVTVEVPT